ncbi:hypothetical protein BCV70DRAFT_197145 [Testicularia cyperi]|uniref:Uncharacterized protein n=1 Tax=Testicularia cyperi TaxID=1882483 RepID=A0A317XZU1_9BASI|nr:hypothetical protein BCV70DRAFT_197145 [Testicularia cyperi]
MSQYSALCVATSAKALCPICGAGVLLDQARLGGASGEADIEDKGNPADCELDKARNRDIENVKRIEHYASREGEKAGVKKRGCNPQETRVGDLTYQP